MNLNELKDVYVISCIVLGLIILSPTLAMTVSLPEGEKFSELWILGPTHMAENYPFNATPNSVYTVYLGIGNHMGDLEYFTVYVKLRNQTEPRPDTSNATPSSLEPLAEYQVFLSKNETWEKQVSFSFREVVFSENSSEVLRFSVDGHELSNNESATWDEVNHGFYYQLFFELWIYDTVLSRSRFDSRFVGLWLNVTSGT